MGLKALEWWTTHRNSPGMDRSSRRCLLEAIQSAYSKNLAIRADCVRVHCVAEWDKHFAEETAAMKAAIGELTESLRD